MPSFPLARRPHHQAAAGPSGTYSLRVASTSIVIRVRADRSGPAVAPSVAPRGVKDAARSPGGVPTVWKDDVPRLSPPATAVKLLGVAPGPTSNGPRPCS